MFEVGKSKVVVSSSEDKLTVVSSGMTLHEAIEANKILQSEKISIRVIDMFSVKPVDSETIIKNAKETNGLILVVEDHYPEGGMGGIDYF